MDRLDPKDLLVNHIESYSAYHRQKETMTWTSASLLLGGSAVLLATEPFWDTWSPCAFGLFYALILGTGVAGLYFLHHQFKRRRVAAHIVHACNNVAARWVQKGWTEEDLAVETVTAFSKGGLELPKAIADEFHRIMATPEDIWPDRVLTFVVAGAWGLAALLRVLLVWLCKGGA